MPCARPLIFTYENAGGCTEGHRAVTFSSYAAHRAPREFIHVCCCHWWQARDCGRCCYRTGLGLMIVEAGKPVVVGIMLIGLTPKTT